MRIEVAQIPELTDQQSALIDMHSVVNILHVLLSELEYLQEVLRETQRLQAASDEIRKIDSRLRTSERISSALLDLLDCEDQVMKVVQAALEAHPDLAETPDAEESVSNLRSVFRVLDTRVRELQDRAHAPEQWVDHDIEHLSSNFTDVLAAIEKNSKGRFRIVNNVAEQEQKDYVVNISIESAVGPVVNMPQVLQDVLRDLVANARKYTEPGGEITAALVDTGTELRLVVEDSGRGIPPDEIETVVSFGERGSNVQPNETKGGGFGLTKAYLVTRQFGGRMWIDSHPGTGTRITIAIPRAAAH